MFSIKTFSGNNFLDTKYLHIKLFSFKFRIAYAKRTRVNKFNTYQTNRGRVFNFGKQYICFMRSV